MKPQEYLPQRAAENITSLRRRAVEPEQLFETGRIVEDVRERGENALIEWSEKFGDLEPGERWIYGPEDLRSALDSIPAYERAVLERTAERIAKFAKVQLEGFRDASTALRGGFAGQRVLPVSSAGCYAPGGRFPLPSSVLMTAVTARVAGVRRVVVASPKPTTITLAAAAVAGADLLIAVGGAQAISALAYGCGEVEPVDVIAGPGNSWVTAAKKWVAGDVGIDMLAGPSELVVVADGTADPELVAADLIAQAEHDPEALPILVTMSSRFVDRVREALSEQLADLPTREIAEQALRRGFATIVGSRAEAADVCNQVAPEHLQVMVDDDRAFAELLTNFGGLFIGPASAEVLGDYGAGPNHVLPTGSTARFGAGLSVRHFLRAATWLELEAGADPELVADAVTLARLEGLEGHARAAERRL